jgi:hypothetical protein
MILAAARLCLLGQSPSQMLRSFRGTRHAEDVRYRRRIHRIIKLPLLYLEFMNIILKNPFV